MTKQNNTPTENHAPIRDDVTQLIHMIETFGTLLQQETTALEKVDFNTVDTLQQDKKDIAKRYHEHVVSLAGRPDEMRKVERSLREKLLLKRTDFTHILAKNLQALDTAKGSAKRLIDRILEAARDTVIEDRHTHYSAKGQTGSYKSATLSLRIDQNL